MLAQKLNITFGIITILIILLQLFLPETIGGVDHIILLISLLSTGIPHGAIDHLIFLKSSKPANNPIQKKISLIRDFFIPYVLLIVVTFICWLFFPEFMFWFFLLVAAYHFGQSQLFYINPSVHIVVQRSIFITWGVFILSALWYFHWDTQQSIIATLFNWDLSRSGMLFTFIRNLFYGSAVGFIFILTYVFAKRGLSLGSYLLELGVASLLLLLIQFTTLYLAFAIYFGLWHSARVMITEYCFLNKEEEVFNLRSLLAFIKSFLPFSLISFAGLALLFWASFLLQAAISPFMLFLVFISALTMPHAFFMEQLYRIPNLGRSARYYFTGKVISKMP